MNPLECGALSWCYWDAHRSADETKLNLDSGHLNRSLVRLSLRKLSSWRRAVPRPAQVSHQARHSALWRTNIRDAVFKSFRITESHSVTFSLIDKETCCWWLGGPTVHSATTCSVRTWLDCHVSVSIGPPTASPRTGTWVVCHQSYWNGDPSVCHHVQGDKMVRAPARAVRVMVLCGCRCGVGSVTRSRLLSDRTFVTQIHQQRIKHIVFVNDFCEKGNGTIIEHELFLKYEKTRRRLNLHITNNRLFFIVFDNMCLDFYLTICLLAPDPSSLLQQLRNPKFCPPRKYMQAKSVSGIAHVVGRTAGISPINLSLMITGSQAWERKTHLETR